MYRLLLVLFVSGYAVIELFMLRTEPEMREPDPLNVTAPLPPLMLYSTAFLDLRYNRPKIRLFSFNPCFRTNFSLITTIKGKKKLLSGSPMESNCPWQVDEKCIFNAHTFTVETEENNLTEITLENKNGKVTVPVQIVPRKKEKGLTICVQPVYFYTEFHKIIIFIESWLSQGAKKFIIFYHSSSEEVLEVLEHYRKQGIVQIINWSDFPKLPRKFEEKWPEPNDSIYRFGHLIAQNLCSLMSTTEFTSIVDFDEVIAVQNMSTLNFVSTMFGNSPRLGAIHFKHQNIRFYPPLVVDDLVDFDGIVKPRFLNISGPNKYIFRTDAVEIASTHSVYKFIDKKYLKMTVKPTHGLLYHHRYNNENIDGNNVNSDVDLFYGYSNVEAVILLQKKMSEIFIQTPTMSYNSATKLAACISRLKLSSWQCRATGAYCSDEQLALQYWLFAENTDNFTFL